jgi:predicted metal-dependent hydrolase
VRVLGAQHDDTLIAVENLAGLLFRARRFAEAEPVLTEAWSGLRGARGDGDEAVRRFAQRLHALYTAWGKPDEAARFAAGE